jgi:hypothetical protein
VFRTEQRKPHPKPLSLLRRRSIPFTAPKSGSTSQDAGRPDHGPRRVPRCLQDKNGRTCTVSGGAIGRIHSRSGMPTASCRMASPRGR